MWADDDNKFGMSNVTTSFEHVPLATDNNGEESALPEKVLESSDDVFNPPPPPIEKLSIAPTNNVNTTSGESPQNSHPHSNLEEAASEDTAASHSSKIKHSGILEKRGHFRSTWKTSWFELRGQTLSVYDFQEGIKGAKKATYILSCFSTVDIDQVRPTEEPIEVLGLPSTTTTSTTPRKSLAAAAAASGTGGTGLAAGTAARYSLCNNAAEKVFFSVKNIKMEETLLLDSELLLSANSMDEAMTWVKIVNESITDDIFSSLSEKYSLSEVITRRFNPAVKFSIDVTFNTRALPVVVSGLQPLEDIIIGSIEALGIAPPMISCVAGSKSNVWSIKTSQASYYTILMLNPDFKWKGGDTKDNFIHWMEVNATISASHRFVLKDCSSTLCDYVPPCPTYNSGSNRILLLIFQQTEEVQEADFKSASRCASRFTGFESQDLFKHLHIKSLISLNCFNCIWEPFVDSTLDSIGMDPHPNHQSAKDANVDISGAQFLKIVSSMRRAETKIEHLEKVLHAELQFKKAAHEQFQEFSSRLDEERLAHQLIINEMRGRADGASRQLELTEASLGALRRTTSDSSSATTNRIDELTEEAAQLKFSLETEVHSRKLMEGIVMAEIERHPFLKSQLAKRVGGYGDEKIHGVKYVQDLKAFVEHLNKQNLEKSSKVDSLLVENTKVKGHFDELTNTKKSLEEQVKELEEHNALLRTATSSTQNEFMAEMESLNGIIKQLQVHLKEEKQSVERLQSEAALSQRSIDSLKLESGRMRDKHAEDIAKLKNSDMDVSSGVLAKKTGECEELKAELAIQAELTKKFSLERDEEKDAAGKLRTAVKGQEEMIIKKEKEPAAITADYAKLRAELNGKQSQIEKKIQENAELQTSLTRQKESAAKAEATVQSLEATLSRKDSEVSMIKAEIARMRSHFEKEIQMKDELFQSKSSEYEALRQEVMNASQKQTAAAAGADSSSTEEHGIATP